jgi:undecaprenyl-diphosphatase
VTDGDRSKRVPDGDRAPRAHPAREPGDPVVASASPRGWRAWALRVVRREPERLAGFGGALLLGAVMCVLLLYAFARLATEVLEQETTSVDLRAYEFVHGFASPALDALAPLISLLGSEAIAVIGGVLVAVFLVQRRWGAAGMLVLVAVGAQLLNDVLKASFQRSRPEPLSGFIAAQQYSFPSGHAMVSAAFYGYLAFLSWRLLSGGWRLLMVAGFVLLVLAIGASRIYLQAHYFTDVIAGYLCGLVWVDACIIGSRLLVLRHPRRARRARTVRA